MIYEERNMFTKRSFPQKHQVDNFSGIAEYSVEKDFQYKFNVAR